MIRMAFQIMVALASFNLGACVAAQEIKSALFVEKEVNLTDNTYAAADMLAQQTRAFLTPMTPLRIGALVDVTSPNEVTPLGQQIGDKLGARFVQLGYNVRSMAQPPEMVAQSQAMTETMGGAPQIQAVGGPPLPMQMGVMPSARAGEALITGTYVRGKDSVAVSLRVIQAPDQRVVAAYDYALPMTSELREMSMTAAQREYRRKYPVSALFQE